MKIKDIVNREIVNLTNCDQEPIHIPGSIQPHGFLIAFDLNHVIQFCSGNITGFIALKPVEVLGKNFREILGDAVYELTSAYINVLTENISAPLLVELKDKKFNCSIHKSKDLWIAEYEVLENTTPKISTVIDQTLQFTKYMQQSQTLQQLCAKVAEEVRSLTGYDRVMIYRFDKDYNGEIFAESKREDLESFLGLHYPHTDIPAQARQLYIKNLLRLIVDVNYEPVPIYTLDDVPVKNLDLGFSALRSVSPIHIQYLQNMGVGATLTISLLHEEKLWGLIACHHYSVKYLDYYARINAQLQGYFLTSQINVRQAAEEYAVSKEVNYALEKLLNESFTPDRDSLSAIINKPELLAICNAAGVAIVLDEVIYKHGNTPPDEEIETITGKIAESSKQGIFSSSKLIGEFPELQSCTAASGVIFCSLSSLAKASITWFNPETLEEVNWGGDPEKAIIKDEKGLHPRKSFETWKQVVKCQAREWAKSELSAASSYAYALQKHITLLLLTEEENRQRQLSEKLKETNAELENINWLSTHDLKEPLRKIQMFSSRLLVKEKNLSPDTNNMLSKISESAMRMQRLLADLMAYSRLRHSNENYLQIDLLKLLQNIVTEINEEITSKKALINLSGSLPRIYGVQVFIHELFINLIHNALKFSRIEIAPEVTISYEGEVHYEPGGKDILYHRISVKDNGVGFSNKFNQDIFKIFTRLNNSKPTEGSGVGLALCKKIMQMHNGFITAEGKVNKGAIFTLYFPTSIN